MNRPIKTGLWFVAGRLFFFVLLAIPTTLPSEADMMALADLPTIGVYKLLSSVGISLDIANRWDPIFHLLGFSAWFVLGMVVAQIFTAGSRFLLNRRS